MAPGAVLVVDDDTTLLKLVKLTLENEGFFVRVAVDGADALKQLAADRDQIGVAVIDYEMPGERLTDLLQEIRTERADLRLIVTSGYSLEVLEELGGCLPAGVDFLKKPFMPRDLVAAVQRAFTRVSGSGN